MIRRQAVVPRRSSSFTFSVADLALGVAVVCGLCTVIVDLIRRQFFLLGRDLLAGVGVCWVGACLYWRHDRETLRILLLIALEVLPAGALAYSLQYFV